MQAQMKKAIIILLLLSIAATPSHALTILDKWIYKKDILRSGKRPVLVNRLTGEIKYIQRDNGQWIPLTGQWQEQYQKMYDAQKATK